MENDAGSSGAWMSSRQRKFLWGLLAALFVLRVIMIFQVPFTDTTEARYAEIARKMLETGDWVTPQFEYGVPFWGKPPLHTWMAAAGMAIFGVGHFGARIFIFCAAIVMMAMLYRWTRESKGRDYALTGTVIMASCGLFYVASATVMTDLVMVAGTSLSMAAFHAAITRMPRSKLWGYLFFVGLAIGMLAKGPVAVVLTAFPIGVWVLLKNRWSETWERLPWIKGSLLACAIFVPWYVIAELKTPGFLNYFIVGEHFERFLKSGWEGDLYGSGHAEPKGTIWIFWLLALLPWTFFFLAPLRRLKSLRVGIKGEPDGWSLYLLCWALSPMVFFTMATNIIPTYILTGVPAMCFLAIDLWKYAQGQNETPSKGLVRFFTGTAVTAIVFYLIAYTVFVRDGPDAPKRSQMELIAKIDELRSPASGGVNYWKKRYYSAEFYTGGRATVLRTEEEFGKLLSNEKRDFLVIPQGKSSTLPASLKSRFDRISQFGRNELFYEKQNSEAPPAPNHHE